MSPEERGMIGKKYVLNNIMNEGEKIPDKRYSTEIPKKSIDKVDYIWMDTYCIDAGCNREGI
ncbi:MAG: hypothetical protein AABY38_01885, partial [Planctomycetota bacterium]